MEQETFIFFDNTTGQMLAGDPPDELAVEPLSRDELRKTYRSFPGEEVDPSRIEVLHVDVDLLGHGGSKRGFSVDLDTRRVVPQEG